MHNNIQLAQSKNVEDKSIWAIGERVEAQAKSTDVKFEQILADNKAEQTKAASHEDKSEAKRQDPSTSEAREKTADGEQHKKTNSEEQSSSPKSERDHKTQSASEEASKAQNSQNSEQLSDGQNQLDDQGNDETASTHKAVTKLNQNIDDTLSAQPQSDGETNSWRMQIVANQQQSEQQGSLDESKETSEKGSKESQSGDQNVIKDQVKWLSEKQSVEQLQQKLSELTSGDKATWMSNVMALADKHQMDKVQMEKSGVAKDIEGEQNDIFADGDNWQLTLNHDASQLSDELQSKTPSSDRIDANQAEHDIAEKLLAPVADEVDMPMSEKVDVADKEALAAQQDKQKALEQSLAALTAAMAEGKAANTGSVNAEALAPQPVNPGAGMANNTTAKVIASLLNPNSANSMHLGNTAAQQELVANNQMVESAQMIKTMLNEENTTGLESKSLSEVLRPSTFTSTIFGNDEGGAKVNDGASRIELGGVSLDKTITQSRIEGQTQVKNEAVIKENILFNKQELAANVQQQVGMMMARNMKSVDIRLDPPELGAIQIRMQVNGDQTAVSFVVSSQQAKDALENAMPRLKEMLEQQGMMLADSDVKQDNSGSGEGASEENNGDASAELAGSEQDGEEMLEVNIANASPYRVDYYA